MAGGQTLHTDPSSEAVMEATLSDDSPAQMTITTFPGTFLMCNYLKDLKKVLNEFGYYFIYNKK